MHNRVMITGAASGIGRAAANAFADAGWFVGAYDIDADGVAEWAAHQDAGKACSGALDIVDAEQWQTAIADFEARAGGLDVLVNNAGVLINGPFRDQGAAARKRVVDINVTGVMNGCHAAHDALSRSRGRIINMSSGAAFFGQAGLAVYSASKFAVRGLTEALSVEWADSGVMVCDVMPLFVKTAMLDGLEAAPSVRRLSIRLTADDVAAVVVRAARARRPKLHYCVGWQSRSFKQLLRWSPDWLTRQVNARIGGR